MSVGSRSDGGREFHSFGAQAAQDVLHIRSLLGFSVATANTFLSANHNDDKIIIQNISATVF